MADHPLSLNRRELLAGLGAAALSPAAPFAAQGQDRRMVNLQTRTGPLALREAKTDTIWSIEATGLDGRDPSGTLRFKLGDNLEIAFANELPAPTVLNWRGMGGVAAAEPLSIRPPLSEGSRENYSISLPYAGTLMCDLRLLEDGETLPSRIRPVVVEEREPVQVDQDEVLLIEDWRLRPEGGAIPPGIDAGEVAPTYTVNGQATRDIITRPHERLRLRFINGCQRSVIAIKIENHDIWVMALDGQPSEPFLARNGALVLAPGTRIDAFVDGLGGAIAPSAVLIHDGKEARPIARLISSGGPAMRSAPLPPAPALPSNGLPAQLDLKNAHRFEVMLGGAPDGWTTPQAYKGEPAFRGRLQRTIVLALTNRAAVAAVFHLHGHHFRLLDRLDDGWKPFWLDTLAVEPGKTQRIAFAAEHAGRWLMESTETEWTSPRRLWCYSIE